GSPQTELEKRCVGIDEPGDALASGETALFVLAIDGPGAAAFVNEGLLPAEFAHQVLWKRWRHSLFQRFTLGELIAQEEVKRERAMGGQSIFCQAGFHRCLSDCPLVGF